MTVLVNGSLQLKKPLDLPPWFSDEDSSSEDAMLRTLYALAERSKHMKEA